MGSLVSLDLEIFPKEKELKMNTNINSQVQIKGPAKKARTSWWGTVGLILLSVIPLIFGALRLNELANGAEITPDNARFFASPSPVVIHIISSAMYALLGAFQFVSRLWRRGNNWHRWVGRLLVPCGLLVGGSGLWMTVFYPRPEGASDLLYAFRLLFGLGMVLSVILGYVAIRRRDIIQHRAWMTRAYAIGLGAGTQVLTGIVGALTLGTVNEFENALLMGAAWIINLVFAEWLIRRRPNNQARTAVTVVPELQ
jgi:uncharacterized membrane protein